MRESMQVDDLNSTSEWPGGSPPGPFPHRNRANPVLNPNTLQALRDLAEPGEPDVFEEFAEIFLMDAPIRLREIQMAYENREAATVKLAAHNLKGSSANMGADQLSACCRELELAGAVGDWEKLEFLAEGLQTEYDAVVTALGRERASRNSTN